MYVFCLSFPSATLQHGGFVPCEWLAAKGLFVWLVTQNLPSTIEPTWDQGPRSQLGVIKSHKPPRHVKVQHLGKERTAVELSIVSTNAFNHFPRKLSLVKRTNLASL